MRSESGAGSCEKEPMAGMICRYKRTEKGQNPKHHRAVGNGYPRIRKRPDSRTNLPVDPWGRFIRTEPRRRQCKSIAATRRDLWRCPGKSFRVASDLRPCVGCHWTADYLAGCVQIILQHGEREPCRKACLLFRTNLPNFGLSAIYVSSLARKVACHCENISIPRSRKTDISI